MATTFDQGISEVIANSPNLRDQLGQGQNFSDMSQATRQLVAEGAAIASGNRGMMNSSEAQGFISGNTPRATPRQTGAAPAQSAAPSTTPPPATTPSTDLTSLIEQRYGSLLNPGLTEAQIQQQEMDRVQSQIDALNSIYDSKIQAEQVQNRGRLGQGRSMNALSGTAWDPFGAANTANIESQNRAIIDQIQKERAAELSNIYAAARGEATRRVEKQSEQLSANTNAYIDSMAQAYSLSQDEAQSLRDNAARVAALTGIYNGGQTLDSQAQDFEQNLSLKQFLFEQTQAAEQNSRANQELDLKVEAARQSGYQVATMDDGSVGYWDFTQGVPKFVTIGNYAKLGDAGTAGGRSGYDPSLATAAINDYFDTFGQFPSKADEANVIDRYAASLSSVPADGSYGPVMPYPVDPFGAGRDAQLQYKSTGTSSSGGAFQIGQ